MKRYFRLFLVLVKQNFIQEMEFRKNFVIRIVSQIFFVVLQIVIVDTYFRFTSNIGSWSRTDVFVLVGLFRLVEGAFHMFLHSNLMYLPETINQGELDGYLTRPVNTVFLVSLRQHQWYEISTFLSGVAILIYALPHGNVLVVLNIFLLALLGFVALYSIMLFFSTWSFFVSRLTAISSMWDAVSKISRFPLDIYGTSKALFFLAPLFLVVTLPAQIILGKVSIAQYTIQIMGTVILLLFAYKFWQFALRRYSSASS